MMKDDPYIRDIMEMLDEAGVDYLIEEGDGNSIGFIMEEEDALNTIELLTMEEDNVQ